MKTRAAVAWQAGKPLTIEEVELQGRHEFSWGIPCL
jgi:Zn-dependent alcohol dehydrogenase